MTVYVVASDEGAARYGTPVGETVDLDLDQEQELALTAAGWLEHNSQKKPKESEQ